MANFGWSEKNENLEYSGYPVLEASEKEVVILAPNITSFGSYTLESNKELLFIPSLWSMKNIRTHLEEGALQEDRGVPFYAQIKHLGDTFYGLIVSNDASYELDDMQMDTMGVQTGDEVILGEVFPVEHEGSHPIVGFGRNIIVFDNPDGNGVETETGLETDGSYSGILKQMIKVSEGEETPIQIRDYDSVKIGSEIEIPDGEDPWFDRQLIGKHQVTDYGFINDFTGLVDGDPDDMEHTTFWVEVVMSKNAPFVDTKTSYVDDVNMLKEPNSSYVSVKGSSVSSDDSRDVFVEPMPSKVFGFANGAAVYPVKLPVVPEASKGIDGYSTMGGIVETAHRSVDGDDLEEGWRASGTKISIMPPVPKFVRVEVDITVDPSTNVEGITGVAKSAIVSYVNSLQTGEDVILSAMTAICQKITGVIQAEVSVLDSEDGRLIMAEDQKAVVKLEDILIK